MTEVERVAGSMALDADLLSDFILESQDHLRKIELNLLKLEENAGDNEAIHSIFRSFHNIKGLAGFFEFSAVQEVAHEVETILDLARNSRLTFTPEVVDVVLEAADYLDRWISALEAGGRAPDDHSALLERVRGLARAEQPAASPDLKNLAGALAPGPAIQNQRVAAKPRRRTRSKAPDETRTLRVDTRKLDRLVDLIGELGVVQSLIQHDPALAALHSPPLEGNLARLALLTDEIHNAALAMRTMPVGQLFQRMSRMVRDLARRSGKQVEVDISGEGAELDRNLVEELADPLIHMLRNAMDHGIESPEERVARGKPVKAMVRMRATLESGQIVIEVSDDGRGLDRAKIVDKAVAQGLIASGDNLPDAQILNLIFEPGLSTVERVTDVSGRGFGMDIVRRRVQKRRGEIEIESHPGKGATFLLKLPLAEPTRGPS